MSDVAELHALLEGAQKHIKVSFGEIVVQEMVVGQIPPFVSALAPIEQFFAELGESREFDLVELIQSHGPDVIKCVAAATGVPYEKIGLLRINELIDVIAAVLELNRDFFVQVLLRRPGVRRLIFALQPGQTSGSDSLQPATDAQTSPAIA